MNEKHLEPNSLQVIFLDLALTEKTKEILYSFQNFCISKKNLFDVACIHFQTNAEYRPGIVCVLKHFLESTKQTWPGQGIHGIEGSAWIELARMKRKRIVSYSVNQSLSIPQMCICVPKFYVVVSTYVANQSRQHTFQKSLDSLMRSKTVCTEVILVDDRSPIQEHLHYAQKRQEGLLTVIQRPSNGGISKCKNTCLKELLDKNAWCALADDDIEYFPGFEDLQVSGLQTPAQEYGPIHLLCASLTSKQPKGTFEVVPKTISHGYFLSFHSSDISSVGYFKVFPNKQGHEHVWWTLRFQQEKSQQFFFDVSSSTHYVKHGLGPPSLSHNEMSRGLQVNTSCFDKDRDKRVFEKQACIEK